MPETKASRPAHRPSRRQQLIEGAVDLFSVKPPELVTVAEIARHAEMTPAAFYYHFSSRTELFQEAVGVFGEHWTVCAEQWWGEASDIETIVDVAFRLMDEAADRPAHANLFFVTSKGVNLAIEDIRQGYLARAAGAAGEAMARCRPGVRASSGAVRGVALMSVLECSLRAELTLEPEYRTLGPGKFRNEARELFERVIAEQMASQPV